MPFLLGVAKGSNGKARARRTEVRNQYVNDWNYASCTPCVL